MSTTLSPVQFGWVRKQVGQTEYDGTYTYVLPDVYETILSGQTACNPIGSVLAGELRAYWLFSVAGLSTISAATFQAFYDTADTYNISGQTIAFVDATSSYANFLAGTVGSADFGNCGSGATLLRSLLLTNSLSSVGGGAPTYTSFTLNSTAVSTINSAIGGSGHFVLGAYMHSINLTQRMILCGHTPALPPQLVVS